MTRFVPVVAAMLLAAACADHHAPSAPVLQGRDAEVVRRAPGDGGIAALPDRLCWSDWHSGQVLCADR